MKNSKQRYSIWMLCIFIAACIVLVIQSTLMVRNLYKDVIDQKHHYRVIKDLIAIRDGSICVSGS